MKPKIVLVTGGARSGKSRFAEQLLSEHGGRKFYLATMPLLDAESVERVRRHRERRAGRNWTTIEEECELVRALRQAAAEGAGAVLVDCLTLWLNNLFYRAEKENRPFGESEAAEEARKLVETLREQPFDSVLVINEVGLGLVPETPLGRRFRDASGRCAQIVAEAADELYFCVAGIPRRFK